METCKKTKMGRRDRQKVELSLWHPLLGFSDSFEEHRVSVAGFYIELTMTVNSLEQSEIIFLIFDFFSPLGPDR